MTHWTYNVTVSSSTVLLWVQYLKDTFNQFLIAKLMNKSLKELIIHPSTLLRLLSEIYQMSMSARMVFKWLHIAWTGR